MISIDLSDTATLNIEVTDLSRNYYRRIYCCIINGIIKSETINFIQNIDLREHYKT